MSVHSLGGSELSLTPAAPTLPPRKNRAFWLVTTVEPQRIDVSQGRAELRIYSKWSFLEPDLIQQLKDGRRELQGASVDDDTDVEQCIERLARGERVSSLELRDMRGQQQLLRGE